MTPRTELENMLAGELYRANDPELTAMRLAARRLTRQYNATIETETQRRVELLRELFGKVGPKVEIEPPFYCDYGRHIFAEDGLYMNFGCVVLDCNEVHIGRSVMFGPYVQVLTAYHPLDAAQRTSGPELAAPIRIGHRVWIGGGAIICPRVTIGDDSVVGAGSVVVKDVPPRVVVAGNPARVIRTIDEQDADRTSIV